MIDTQIVGCNGFYSRTTLNRFLYTQKCLGRRHISFYPLPAHLWLDHFRCIGLDNLCEELNRAGLSIISFNVDSLQYSLFEDDNSLRGRSSRAYYRRCVDVAQALSCKMLCIRPVGSLLDREYAVQWENLVHNLFDLCGYAALKDINICIQTITSVEGKLLQKKDELVMLLERVPYISVVLDTVSLTLAGETISQWFTSFGTKISHVRFWDGRSDGGRIWGEGVYPSQLYFTQLLEAKYSGIISLCGLTDRYQDSPEESDAENMIRGQKILGVRKGQ